MIIDQCHTAGFRSNISISHLNLLKPNFKCFGVIYTLRNATYLIKNKFKVIRVIHNFRNAIDLLG